MTYETVQFKKGDVIFRKDDLQFFFYEIVSGEVDIYSDYGEKAETKLITMRPGQTFGELSILDYRPRSATAVAATDVNLYKINDETFESYVKDDPARLTRMMAQISARTRDLTADYNEALKTVADIRSAEKKDSGFFARLLKFAKVWRVYGTKG